MYARQRRVVKTSIRQMRIRSGNCEIQNVRHSKRRFPVDAKRSDDDDDDESSVTPGSRLAVRKPKSLVGVFCIFGYAED
ncbi:hypothetical protein GWI33_010380 [Rhynchophorus ferrugineus]|uniref:Uncharacterized protein n=1 Tax=Rhynchophorus ferrugineus TaxID=354439 RepID=A0A834IBU0_RHYFE|nr:hypothetical protein GWI33_010380 [Rhynchophorus ferrugineus]